MLILADARAIPLADGSVQMVMTSPPYWGLRDYGVSGQIGLEPTPQAYVENIRTVFREIKRVLREDGTVWLNLGDSYCNAGSRNNGSGLDGKRRGGMEGSDGTWADSRDKYGDKRHALKAFGIKHKDLIGIPWRVAFALQADGWYLRSDIIWAKGVSFLDSYSGSVMPESVRDRPTKAHEYLFLLTKSPRYYYDAAAIAEDVSDAMRAEVAQGYEGKGRKDYAAAGVQNPSSVKARIIERARGKVYTAQAYGERPQSEPRGPASNFGLPLKRNLRDVWVIGPRPYRGAHFATFPPALVIPTVRAGSRPGDLVLDPFVGSGTVGAVCAVEGRRFVGMDLNPEYLKLATARIEEARRKGKV